ncbi:ATP-binding cassette domain-containing protein [Streptomyces sp. NPDC005125]
MNHLLQIDDLRLRYPGGGFHRRMPEVLKGVSLHIEAGETLGLVGESGSGKTTVGRAVLGLARASKGAIAFDGQDITHLPAGRNRGDARDIQVVFQDPYTSLTPALPVRGILTEPLIAQGITRSDAERRVSSLLDRVGLPKDSADRFAREFSGGQRQRIAIARALALEPRLIVCDEPVSALDLTTQARVLDLLIELQRNTGVAYLFITHDLAVVRHISHRVAVMHQGEIVETGPAATVTKHPRHDYTKHLLLAAPVADPNAQAERRASRQALRGRTEAPAAP